MRAPRGPRAGDARAGNLPGRAEIIQFVNSAGGRVGRREIAREFGIRGQNRTALNVLLRQMAAEGLIEGTRRKPRAAGTLPPAGLARVAEIDNDGTVTIVPLVESETDWPPMTLRGMKDDVVRVALGRGDRVLVRFITGDDADPHARLIRHLPEIAQRIVGIVGGAKGGPFHLSPVSKRARDDLPLDPAGLSVSPGDLVSAEIAGRTGHRIARAVELHGSAAAPGAVSLIAIHEHEIPDAFPRAALEEAAAAIAPPIDGRADLRAVPFVTIDPEDARDHDDAVQAEPDGDRKNRGGWIVRVAIADVAHFVRPGSALDREARLRGNSVYFPDRVVPMLPEALSTDLCSLKSGAERAAFVVTMTFDKTGTLKKSAFARAIIISRADLNYVETQDAIDGAPSERAAPLIEEAIRPLWAAYTALKSARERREPLELDLPERRIVLDDAGKPVAIVTPPRLEAHRLIEEFMIQANVATAETLDTHRGSFLRRIHDAPAPEKLDALAAYLQSLEMRLPRGQVMTPAHFNRVIGDAAATPHAEAVSDAILRSQAQAHYAPRDLGHFGLNLRRYAHFTSPIRRYADLIAHRALITALSLGPDGLDRETIANLEEIGQQISDAERRAMAAERATADRLIAQFLSDQVGAKFTGRVAGIVRSGLFVELDETGANGFVAAAELGRKHDDYFAADEASRSLAGRSSGLGYRVGARVEIRLRDADPVRGTMEFEMLTAPKKVPGLRKSGRRPAKRKARGKAR